MDMMLNLGNDQFPGARKLIGGKMEKERKFLLDLILNVHMSVIKYGDEIVRLPKVDLDVLVLATLRSIPEKKRNTNELRFEIVNFCSKRAKEVGLIELDGDNVIFDPEYILDLIKEINFSGIRDRMFLGWHDLDVAQDEYNLAKLK